MWRQLRENAWPVTRGLLCQHLNRTSPAFAILAAIAPGVIGWFCYGMAITQYLIIGLVTSRDKALDVLSKFDRQVAIRRRELVKEFNISDEDAHQSDEDAHQPDDDCEQRAEDDERDRADALRSDER